MKLAIAFIISWPWLSFAAIENRISVATAIYKPFIILQEDGRLDGIYHEYFLELIKKAGLEASFEAMPIPRVINHAEKGTFDLLMFIADAPEVAQNYIEVRRIQKLQMVLVTLEKNAQLKGKPIHIGIPSGTICHAFSKDEEKNVRYFEYESIEQAMKMMTSGRVSALCTTRERFHYVIHHSTFANTKYYEIPEYHREITVSLFAHKRLSGHKINLMSKAAQELEQKKFLSILYKKYGMSEDLIN